MGNDGRERGEPGERAPIPAAAGAEARAPPGELAGEPLDLALRPDALRAARAEVEAALRRYAELFDVAPIAYFVVGSDGAVRDLNSAAARLLGAERALFPGRPLRALVADGDQETLARLLGEARGGRSLAPDAGCGLVTMRRPLGGTVQVRLCASPLAGQGDAVLVAGEDVTAQREAEDALRDRERHKDELLATLSHELRNPLEAIRNGLRLLAPAPPGSAQAARALRVVERQVGHLSRIVDDLLDVARIARGKIQLRREPVELGELVRRTADDHRATFDDAGLALEVRLPRSACWVLVDATRVAQIVGNLLGNAAKFTAAGGRVEITLRREARTAAVTIRDTGVGIAPDLQRRLFEPFAQAPQALDRSRGGLGLGLATVKGLVELHGGTVDLASRGLGQGAEFTVHLPRCPTPAAAEPPAPPPPAGGCRVLVVDDNEDAATTLQEILSLSGHEVRVALDGPQGVAVARAFAPEVVLCDIGLPGMDGYAVARALRGDPATRDAYLVALTGYALPDDVRRALEAGFDRHLAKPLGVDSLERALDARPSPAGPVREAGVGPSPGAGA